MNEESSIIQQGLDWWQYLGGLVAIGSFLYSLYFAATQGRKSYLLLRRINAGKRQGGVLITLATLANVLWHNPGSLFSRAGAAYLENVRVRAEHELFDPRPIYQWPLPDTHEDYGSEGTALEYRGRSEADREAMRKQSRAAVKKLHREARARWRRKMRRIYVNSSIKLPVAGELNDALSGIKHYFETLKTLGAEFNDELKFVCNVRIANGFISSQHLLAGLLVRYNEKWSSIIDGFERDTSDIGEIALERRSADFRQIQSFIYHCWLLWGPSIPICSTDCGGWNAPYSTLQYGYGDENNSIEVVGQTDLLRDQLAALVKDSPPRGAMAIRASVHGQLQYSSIADLKSNMLPPALKLSWEGSHDERPILYISARDIKGRAADAVSDEIRGTGGIGPEEIPDDVEWGERQHHLPDRSRYYSAYLWVMFIILRKDGHDWVPIHAGTPDGRHKPASAEPWKASIPFFEHGNLADAETCAFSKRQLAEKAVAGLAQLAAMGDVAEFPHRFAYACAIDDPNCGKNFAFDTLSGGETVREMMAQIMARRRSDPDIVRAASAIDFDYYAPFEPHQLNPHSSCTQTRWVSRHYEELDSAAN